MNVVQEHFIKLHHGHVLKELIAFFKQNINIDKDLFCFQMILPTGAKQTAEDGGGSCVMHEQSFGIQFMNSAQWAMMLRCHSYATT